nr:hypothetical protein [Tanacetum cinerariifolium]
MTSLADKAILSGADNHPPMLEKDMYDSWKSRMELCMLNRQHGRIILESVENGLLLWPTVEENGVTRSKKYSELSATKAIQVYCDVKETNIILQGLLPEVYALVDDCQHPKGSHCQQELSLRNVFYVIEPNGSISINSIIESRDVIFDENRFSSIPRPKDIIPNVQESQMDNHTDDVPNEIHEPQKVDDEIGSIMENNTWVLSDLPPGCKTLGCKWIFKRKMKVDGTIGTFKDRLVAQKKLEEKKIEEERTAKAKYWNLPVCYDDDDDEERSDSLDDNLISGLPSLSAIIPDEPVLSTEEPDNSLSMGDEHLDTILATESDEFIKSDVENLILIPSESEGIPEHVCDVPSHDNSPPLDVLKDQIEDFSKSNAEFSSIDDDSFSIDDIDYVEASPPDSELVSPEVMEIVIPESPLVKGTLVLRVQLVMSVGEALEKSVSNSSMQGGSWGHENRDGNNLCSWLKECFGNYQELDYELMRKLKEYW